MSSSPDRFISSLWRHGVLALTFAVAAPWAMADSSKLDAGLRGIAGYVDVLVHMQPVSVVPRPLRGPGEDIASFRSRLVEHWRGQAERSQSGLRAELDAQGIAWKSFWLVDALSLRVDASQLSWLTARADVAHVFHDAAGRRLEPAPPVEFEPRAPSAVEWGVELISAPQVWVAGFTGQGAVIAGQDTGVFWNHDALIRQYRGWDGSSASHDYNWHDAIHELIDGGSNSCGLSLSVPCDDHSHGTHTVGTAVGDDGGANRIGVAPDAKWIACRNMEAGIGRPTTYAECFQWFVAPTDLAGHNPRPDLAPDVIINSWGCPATEMCTDPAILQEVVQNVRDAGIVVVVSAGNSGSSCNTIDTPAAIYDAAFTVGSSNSADEMSSFSSRGPSPYALTTTMKPNVVAPGSSVRSATLPGTNTYISRSGTSMAGPHVAGAVALLISANPRLRGDVDRIEQILSDTAVPLTFTQTCGGVGPTTWPNYVAGHGRIDVWAAFRVAETIFSDDWEGDDE